MFICWYFLNKSGLVWMEAQQQMSRQKEADDDRLRGRIPLKNDLSEE